MSRKTIAQRYLGLLRDSGFATGTMKKKLRLPFVAPSVVLFGVRLILGGGAPASAVPENPLFTTLGLTSGDVIDALTELHAADRLGFRIQGGVVQIQLKEGGEPE